MKIILVLGKNDSGKSLFAEKLSVEEGTIRYYLATMMPHTKDNYLRIEKHRKQRMDKGFDTLEVPWEIDAIQIPDDSVVLLEDISNLLANGIFSYGADGKLALEKVQKLAKKCKTLIIVSISGLTDQGYDEGTVRYIDDLNWINQQLIEMAETIYYMVDGVPVKEQSVK